MSVIAVMGEDPLMAWVNFLIATVILYQLVLTREHLLLFWLRSWLNNEPTATTLLLQLPVLLY